MASVIDWLKAKGQTRRPLFEDTRRRLALWYTGAMGAIVVTASLGLLAFYAQGQYAEVDRDLVTLSQTIIGGVEAPDGDEDDDRPLHLDLEHLPFIGHETRQHTVDRGYVRLYAENGHLLREAGNALGVANHRPSPGLATLSGAVDFRARTVAVVVEGQTLGFLELGLPLAPVEANVTQVALMLAVGVPLVLFAVGCAGWWLAGLAIEPIEAAYTRLTRFTADAGHELRTPLAAIRANAQWALRDESRDPEHLRESLLAIDRTGERMGHLVADLLFLARYDGSAPSTARRSCRLEEVLADLDEELAPLAREAGVDLTVRRGEMTVPVRGEPDQLYRLFTNLITNAVKYTPAGGTVTVELATAGRSAVIAVGDTGIGIPLAHRPHIFERFYQVDAARTRKGMGYGLGLAICRAITEAHGGTVELTASASAIDGETPTGSLFTVKLPLDTSAQPTSEPFASSQGLS
jgi:signal transduction histidine kinase